MGQRGGSRPGAGRPKGSGFYNEPTQTMRVPKRLMPAVKTWLSESMGCRSRHRIPLFGSQLSAGFPDLQEAFVEDYIDLQDYLVQDPVETFCIRFFGDSMIGAGIYPGDLLVVDRHVKPIHAKIVVAALESVLKVRRLHQQAGIISLNAENPAYEPIYISRESDLTILGVVLHAIHTL